MVIISYISGTSRKVEGYDTECRVFVRGDESGNTRLRVETLKWSCTSTCVLSAIELKHGLVQVVTSSGSVYTFFGSADERKRLINALAE